MTPFEIVLLACLSADPSNCVEQRIPYESAGSLKQCVYEAQGVVAQWMSEHTDRFVKKYGCEINGVKQSSGQ